MKHVLFFCVMIETILFHVTDSCGGVCSALLA